MKYYFEYEVIFTYRNGKSGKLTLRADNPAHLLKRFREKYPSRLIVKYYHKLKKETLRASLFLVYAGYTVYTGYTCF